MTAWGYSVGLRPATGDSLPVQVRTAVTLGDATGPTKRFVYTEPEIDTPGDRPQFGQEWDHTSRKGKLEKL